VAWLPRYLFCEIAQLVYSHIDLVLSDKSSYERRTEELFGDLGLERETYRNPSKRREKLEPALKELEGVRVTTGTITSARLEKTKDGADFKAVFRKGQTKGERAEVISPSEAEERAEVIPPAMSQAEALVGHFHRVFHGAEEALPTARALDQAADLIARLGMERARHVIDFAHREAPKTKHRVATFGGVLQYATAALRDFERRAEAPAVRETAGTEARRARRESEARVREFWQSLPPEQRAALEAEALAGAAPATRAECEAAAAPVRRLLLVGLRDALIRQRLGLPAAD
jgi:hypothetical protein